MSYRVHGVRRVGRTLALRANARPSYFHNLADAKSYAHVIHVRTGVIVAIEAVESTHNR